MYRYISLSLTSFFVNDFPFFCNLISDVLVGLIGTEFVNLLFYPGGQTASVQLGSHPV